MKQIISILIISLSVGAGVAFAQANDPCPDLMTRVKAGEKIPSQKWWDCLPVPSKEQVVASLIGMIGRRDGIAINGSAAYYVAEIDALRSENPRLKEGSIKLLLEMVAVMSFDYDEGISREDTLKKYLAPDQAKTILELREQEGTPLGRMPKKILSNAGFHAWLIEQANQSDLSIA